MKKKGIFFILWLFIFSCLCLPAASTQAAKKVTVDVMSQMRFKAYTGDGMVNVDFTYTKKGLVKTKFVHSPDNNQIPQVKTTYTYNSNNMVTYSEVYLDGKKAAAVTYKYNAKNQLISRKTSSTNGPAIVITVKYTYKKGVLASATTTYKGTQFDPTLTTFTFNKKGQPTKIVMEGAENSNFKNIYSYKFDKNGYMKSQTYSNNEGKGTVTRKLTYKKGKLAKYQDTDKAGSNVYMDNARTITWKQLSVPASVADLIDRQQKEIINTIIHYSLLLGNDYM